MCRLFPSISPVSSNICCSFAKLLFPYISPVSLHISCFLVYLPFHSISPVFCRISCFLAYLLSPSSFFVSISLLLCSAWFLIIFTNGMWFSYTRCVSICAPVPVLVYIITIANRVKACFLLCFLASPVSYRISRLHQPTSLVGMNSQV